MIAIRAFCLILSVDFVFGGMPCILNLPASSPSILMQKFGSEHIILSPRTDFLIDEGNFLYAVCSSGFNYITTDYYNYGENVINSKEKIKEILITCKNQAISYQSEDGLALQLSNLECNNNGGQYYRKFVEFCDHEGFLYGFLLKNMSIVLAEICFDSYRMETKFIHYVSEFKSPILEKQTFLRPNVNFGEEVIFPPRVQEDLNGRLVRGKTEEFRHVLNFTMDSLVPTYLITAHYSNLISNFENVNKIPWWISLKYGNWLLLESLISRRGRTNKLNVYTGTSGMLNDFSYRDGAYERNIPFYVWSYIRQDKGTDIVIVGINSPFVKTTDKELIICKDICDQIDWLSSLWLTRKMPAFGYIFCCDPDDHANLLDGFPKTENTPIADTLPPLTKEDLLLGY